MPDEVARREVPTPQDGTEQQLGYDHAAVFARPLKTQIRNNS